MVLCLLGARALRERDVLEQVIGNKRKCWLFAFSVYFESVHCVYELESVFD
jgi:hypothetical protein